LRDSFSPAAGATPDPGVHAARALRAYVAMQSRFGRRDGLYRRDGLLTLPWAASHLWPLARAAVATLDLAGVPAGLLPSFDVDAAVADRLRALERYWDTSGNPAAYASDVLGTRFGGDRYYDDNAWVGLALVQLHRLRPGAEHLQRAADLFRFAVGGWDHRADAPSPGGVFWVEQGRGAGRRNHDRNTVSTAPNAALGLHLEETAGTSFQASGPIRPSDMYEWVNATLDSAADPQAPATGLFWDKLRGDGTVDRALWSYNQGSMIALNVLLARRDPDSSVPYLARAEAIARRALRHYADGLDGQPPEFNAILFRNLLLLHAATPDSTLRVLIRESMRDYADRAWSDHRDRHDCFSFPGRGATLLGQSAMVQLLALLAWDPADYSKLA
jgi:hypothetical protein